MHISSAPASPAGIRVALFLLPVLAAGLAPALHPVARGDDPLHGDVELTLERALRKPGPGGAATGGPAAGGVVPGGGGLAAGEHDLTLHLTCEKGSWKRSAVGLSPGYNPGLHDGEVEESRDEEGALRLSVTLRIARSPMPYGLPEGPEGEARLGLVLRRSAGSLEGTYTLAFQETYQGSARPGGLSYEAQGKAAGRVVPSWPPAAPGSSPAARGEHPRLFFRKGDLPRLRERARTPEGRRMVARLETLLALERGGFSWGQGVHQTKAPPYTEGAFAAGHAFLHCLTGEAAHAERAKLLTLLAMSRNTGDWAAWGNSLRLAGVAMAYDLCFEVWDEPWKLRVAEWLLAGARGRGRTVDLQLDAMFQAAGGLAALAVLGDPWPAPEKPPAPTEARSIAAVSDLAIGNVPVARFSGGHLSEEWLLAGEIEPEAGEDPLASLGGRGGARPEDGTRFKHRGREYRFSLLRTGRRIALARPRFPVQLRDRADHCLPAHAYLYAVLHNDRPRVVRVRPNPWGAQHGPAMPLFGVRLWISGEEARDGELLRLEPGRHPVMVEVALLGSYYVEPRLEEYTTEAHAAALAGWTRESEAWERAGRATPHAEERLNVAARFIRHHLERSMGELGFTSEDSNSTDAQHLLLPFAQAHRSVTGRDLAAGTGLANAIPFQLITAGRFWSCDWGREFWRTLAFPAVVPAAYRPAVRWALDAREDLGAILPWHAAFALLNYPWDVEARAPAELGLPLVFEDHRAGAFVIRSGWDPARDFTALVVLRKDAPRSSLTVGDLTVLGPARGAGGPFQWTGFANAGGGVFRPPCLSAVERPNVLRVKGALPAGGAKLLRFETGPERSAVLSILQDHWVAGTAENPNAAPKVEDPRDLGLLAFRSIAADFSGLSGAPALFAVVDRVEGTGGRPAWVQMTFEGEGRGPLEVEGRAFRLAAEAPRPAAEAPRLAAKATARPAAEDTARPAAEDTARPAAEDTARPAAEAPPLAAKATAPHGSLPPMTLRGTFVPGGAGKPELAMEETLALQVRPRFLSASGSEFYFLVLTIQEGPPPEVRMDGEGPAARVEVGGRVLRFDGERILLEKARGR